MNGRMHGKAASHCCRAKHSFCRARQCAPYLRIISSKPVRQVARPASSFISSTVRIRGRPHARLVTPALQRPKSRSRSQIPDLSGQPQNLDMRRWGGMGNSNSEKEKSPAAVWRGAGFGGLACFFGILIACRWVRRYCVPVLRPACSVHATSFVWWVGWGHCWWEGTPRSGVWEIVGGLVVGFVGWRCSVVGTCSYLVCRGAWLVR